MRVEAVQNERRPYIYTTTSTTSSSLTTQTSTTTESEFSITYGHINTNASSLRADYVNYLAYAITGGYNTADIFSNELDLVDGVTQMDVGFNNIINQKISNVATLSPTIESSLLTLDNNDVFFDVGTSTNPYIMSCQYLLDGLLGINSGTRGAQFLTDIVSQNISGSNVSSSTTGFYRIPFHTGDILSLRLSYVPYTGSGVTVVGNNPIYTRSYKVVLNCISE
jgi:hypothetical protein